MIEHEKADEILNHYCDFESSFLDLIVLIGENSTHKNSDGNPSLHLFWKHLRMLNEQLNQVLKDLTQNVNFDSSADCATGSAGAAKALESNSDSKKH